MIELLIIAIFVPLAVLLLTRRTGRTWHTVSNSYRGVSFFGVLIVGMALSAMNESFYPLIVIASISAILMGLWTWIREIVNLMGLNDEAFPGKHDKVLWLALMILLPPIGVPAFCVFRRAYWPVEKPSMDAVSREMI